MQNQTWLATSLGVLVASVLFSACGDDGASEPTLGGGAAGDSPAISAGSGGDGGMSPTPTDGGSPSDMAGTGPRGGEAGDGATEATAGAGGEPSCTGTASCFIDAEHLCDEWTSGCPAYIAETEESCSNRGGQWASPAACPSADFAGKCELPPNPDGSRLTSRWYTGADTATQESFCSGIGQGVWSTTF